MNEFTRLEMHKSFQEGMYEAAKAMCKYCDGMGPPERNERGAPVHKVYSSRDLATEHACPAQPIYDQVDMMEKQAIATAYRRD